MGHADTIVCMGGARVDRDGLLCSLWEFVQQKLQEAEIAKMCAYVYCF